MRCLGTLEFLYDFYDSCQHTQKELLQAVSYSNLDYKMDNSINDTFSIQQVQNKAEEKLQREDEAESDKENDVTSTKHKPKALSPIAENSVAKNNDSNNLHGDINDCSNDIQPVTCKLVPLENLISNKQPTVRNISTTEKNSMNEQKRDTNFISEKDCITKKTNPSNLLLMDETNVNENSVFPVRRKRGRKSKLEKMKEASLLKKENVVDEKDNFQNKLKKYRLRNNCDNVNSVTKSTVVPIKLEVTEATVKEKVATDSSLNETCIKDRGTDIINDGTVPNKPTETKFSDESSKKPEDNLVKSKAIFVKQEKLEAHNKRAVEVQDYICKICGKRLKSKKALHNHQNVRYI